MARRLPLLFDLSSDPQELNDVSTDPAYLSHRLRCAEALLSKRAEHLDQTLANVALTKDGPVSLSAAPLGRWA